MTETSLSFCGECGSKLQDGAAFCSGCGQPTASRAAPAAPASPHASFRPRAGSAADVAKKAASIASVLKAGPVFFVVYCVLALPTYILPYVGSNSATVNVVMAGAAEVGALPAYWWHLFFLAALACLAWIRGGFIGRDWLPVLPVLAGIFDLTPGLNWIPLAPTGFHVATLIVGVNRPVSQPGQANRVAMALGLAALMLLLALYKSATYENPWERDARVRSEQFQ